MASPNDFALEMTNQKKTEITSDRRANSMNLPQAEKRYILNTQF